MFNWIKKLFGIKPIHQKTNSPSKPLEVENDNTNNIDMKYLIVGLGNMEAKYEDTRHNVGFEIADALVSFKDSTYDIVKLGMQAKLKHKGRTIYVHKPNTYMNLSGKAVKYWMDKYKIKRENVLILVDDLHMDLDVLRLRKKGSHAGHNGLKDIDLRLGGNNYARLKIGIGDNFRQGRQVEFVLGKWSKNEQDQLPEIKERAVKAILDFASVGIDRAMSTHNRKLK